MINRRPPHRSTLHINSRSACYPRDSPSQDPLAETSQSPATTGRREINLGGVCVYRRVCVLLVAQLQLKYCLDYGLSAPVLTNSYCIV